MNRIRGKVSFGLLALAVVGIVGVFAAPLAHAASSCGTIDTAIISCDDNASPILEIVKLVLKILTGLVGIAAVGALIFAGIVYSSASGDQGQVQKAKTMIQNTVIGIVLYGTMFLFGNFLIPGGVFGGDITYSGTGVGDGTPTVSTPGGGGSGGGGGTTSGVYDSITIATWNVLYTNGASDIKAGAKKIASSGADLIGFQELNFPASRNAVKDGLINCSGCAYAGYFPGDSGASGWDAQSKESLVWKKSMFEKLDQGSIRVSGHDAPANTGAKFLTWVKLKDKKTGKSLYFINTHLVASIAPSRNLPNRIGNSDVKQNYLNHLNKLVDFVDGKNDPIFITGDFNMAYHYDKSGDHTYNGHSYSPMRRLNKQDIYSNWQYAKASSSWAIDYVWASKRDDVKYVSSKKWSNHLGSDHAPVTLTIKLYKD